MDNETPTPETNAVPDVPQAAPDAAAPQVDPMNDRQGEAAWWKEDADRINRMSENARRDGDTFGRVEQPATAAPRSDPQL